MLAVHPASPRWAAYLQAVREEVSNGIGVFSEDEELRMLLKECFDRGDAWNGVVAWNDEFSAEKIGDELTNLTAG
jgi:hypothetical protein